MNIPVTTSKELLVIFVIKCFCVAKKGGRLIGKIMFKLYKQRKHETHHFNKC